MSRPLTLSDAIYAEMLKRKLAEVGDVCIDWVVAAAVEDPRKGETEYVIIHSTDDVPLHVAAGLLHCALRSLDGLEQQL